MNILPIDLTNDVISRRQIPDHLINQEDHGMYLQLLHGREAADQDMDDWGFNCDDIIGPLKWAHFVYKTLTTIGWEGDEMWLDDNFTPEACLLMPPNSLCLCGDMFYWNGAFYGDWEFIYR